MTGLTYRFDGPTATATLVALPDVAVDLARVTVTGPFTGGEGLEDPTFASYAARAVLPEWTISGDPPPVPEIPPVDPGVVCAPPAA